MRLIALTDLQMLSTAPKHQKRGAGSMLVKKGLEIADEKGLNAVLEASPAGAPLYKKHGYVEKGRAVFEPRKYGKDADPHVNLCMVRELPGKSQE